MAPNFISFLSENKASSIFLKEGQLEKQADSSTFRNLTRFISKSRIAYMTKEKKTPNKIQHFRIPAPLSTNSSINAVTQTNNDISALKPITNKRLMRFARDRFLKRKY